MNAGVARRDQIIQFLREQGGAIQSRDGRGLTAEIASVTGYHDLSTLNGMLARLEREGLIKRVVRGKRTYRISLLNDGQPAARPRARHDGGGDEVAPSAVAGPSVAELRETIAALTARVDQLESLLQAVPRRRKWRAS